MQLREYLMMKNMTYQDFADLLGCSPYSLANVINGHHNAGKKLRYRVEMITEGKVKGDEITDKERTCNVK